MKLTAMTNLPALFLLALMGCGGTQDGTAGAATSSSELNVRVVDQDGVPQPGLLTDYTIDPFLRAHVTIEGSSGSSNPTDSSLRPYFKEWIRLMGGDDFMFIVLQKAPNYHLTVTSSYDGAAATGGGQTWYSAAFWDNSPDRRVPTLIHETMHIMDSGASSDSYYQAMMADPSKQWDSYAMTNRAEYVACAVEWILTNGRHDANETNRQRLRRMDPSYYAYLCNTLIWNVLYNSQGTGPEAILLAGASLSNGGYLRSSDGQSKVVMQSDGNFGIYQGGAWAWGTMTNGSGAQRMTLQTDGNLVIYDGNGNPKWASGTMGSSGSILKMQNDGNLVLYRQDGIAVWASNTNRNVGSQISNQTLSANDRLMSPDGRFEAVMQTDGNFVLYFGGSAIWASGTQGSGANRVSMQSDGNLVVYDAKNSAKWASGTPGRSGTALKMQSDGNLVIYDSSGAAVWSTGTYGH